MQGKAVRTLALMLLLCGTGIGLAQQPVPKKVRVEEEEDRAVPRAKQKSPPEKSKLEEMLAEALKNNADIRVAVAKLAEAEAELNRTRVQVMQQVVMLHQAIVAQKATVDHEQKKYDRMKTLAARAAIDSESLDEELTKLTVAKAKLAELEAQMPGLSGKVSRDAESGILSRPTRAAFSPDGKALFLELDADKPIIRHRALGPLADKIRKALSRTISVSFANQPVTEIVDTLSRDSGLVIKLGSEYAVPEKLSVRCDNLSFGAVLQLLEDSLPNSTIVVRDYGLLITHRQSFPPGAISVQEFLRQKPTDEPKRQPSSGKNPPADNVEGVVKAVDASGLLTISIGSDTGLSKGHTLELFRLNPSAPTQSKYLGTVRILEAEAHQSVVQPVGRLSAPAQSGDRVASRLLGQ